MRERGPAHVHALKSRTAWRRSSATWAYCPPGSASTLADVRCSIYRPARLRLSLSGTLTLPFCRQQGRKQSKTTHQTYCTIRKHPDTLHKHAQLRRSSGGSRRRQRSLSALAAHTAANNSTATASACPRRALRMIRPPLCTASRDLQGGSERAVCARTTSQAGAHGRAGRRPSKIFNCPKPMRTAPCNASHPACAHLVFGSWGCAAALLELQTRSEHAQRRGYRREAAQTASAAYAPQQLPQHAKHAGSLRLRY